MTGLATDRGRHSGIGCRAPPNTTRAQRSSGAGQNHRMPLCCQVMKDAMRAGEVVRQTLPSGQGATLVILYKLPRP